MNEPKPAGSISAVLSSLKSKFKSQSPQFDLTTVKGYNRCECSVFAVVENFLQPGSKITLEEAADSVIEIFPVGHLDLTPINSVCLDLAEQIPYTHPSLFKLSRLLWMIGRNNRRVINSGHKDVAIAIQSFYQGLGEDLRDNQCDAGADDSDPARFVNYEAFQAHIMETGMWMPSLDGTMGTIEEAFEKIHKDMRPEIQDARILGAAQHILWSGQTLFKLLLWPRYEESIYKDRGVALGKWHTWRDHFRKASEDDGRGEECRGVAKRVVDIMEALEKGMAF
ncbi:hypothetical protein VE03_00114 [Pseudogymnoascus sp. 23342-1-I1]|nr:hypothetical protein VE03_00114 [Pseudogymnoascus sp. 23342-1-I1]